MLGLVLKILQGGVQRRVHKFSVTLALMLAGIVFMLVAGGFGLTLATAWLQQVYGTTIAHAVVGGGCAVIGLILLAFAFWRPAARPRAVPHEAVAPEIEAARHTFDEAIAQMQGGSRETMLAALSLAIVAGIVLGRKL
ncbi:MAG TPA: hypothetical protein VGC38_03750 [Pseudolabrys sp.]